MYYSNIPFSDIKFMHMRQNAKNTNKFEFCFEIARLVLDTLDSCNIVITKSCTHSEIHFPSPICICIGIQYLIFY